MVLHFVKDEKVTDQIIENFERINIENCFLVFSDDNFKEYNYIKSKSKSVSLFNQGDDDIMDIIRNKSPKAILLHSLHLEFAKALLSITMDINIAWYTWGFDVYGLPKIKPSTYAPLTNEFLLRADAKLYFGRIILKYQTLRRLYSVFNSKEESRYDVIFKSIEKITYFVTYIEEDYHCFSDSYPNKLSYLYAPFSTISQYLAGSGDTKVKEDAKHILVGNSNTPECNHLDVFEKLSPYMESNALVYVPLSYGGNETYRDMVLTNGRRRLGPSFCALLDFMSREDYIQMLASCSTGIFYHYRQQAMGNIIAMLYMGARIYMSSKNPAFSFFTKNDIRVFDFDLEFQHFRNTTLEGQIIVKNRTNLNTIFNEKQVLKDLEILAKTISKQ
ncbi:hypothetical protein EJ994_13080 [Maribacter sp. MJ134]|uniref:TDP-N-acetylfucosamine:lipid II N-acetylfucosaminyltransferase n=1 Tax=Maribacter sp. MJ134 TaxID=2496865 RepID=UPI000F846771|nr:TDP-N-acetylfucosamine:lipid II N-acetylfucosaminyltransferase [Maribacter sp. MJ134]AZQ59692.1 hypothetical protein EJ994_13080 [Maribacter sp. MJ134]